MTKEYINYVCEQKDFESYENSCPQLFSHYYKFWSKRNRDVIFNKTDVLKSRDKIQSLLPEIERKFAEQRINIKNITIILFVGMGNTNGHAFKFKDKIVVWAPVETYLNEIDIEVFITHEIAHGLHYSMTREFYFNNQSEQKHIGRQLITEGLASYFSKIVLDITDEIALWGNYLEKIALDSWFGSCENKLDEIKTVLKSSFDNSDNSLGLFYANNKNDVFNFRCGYYAGLKLVEQIANENKLSLIDLLEIPRDTFDNHIKLLL